ncbi:MAG: HAD family hydrolase [Candidatus Heimdallarchaeota archaeon]
MTSIKAVFFDLGDTLIREYHKGEPAPNEPVVFPNVKEVIQRLSDRFILAIISNTITAGSQKLRELLKMVTLDSYFTTVLASAEEGVAKPDPEIYKKALTRLGLSANEALMVGNRISRDILGGNRAGIRSILIWHQGMDHHPDDKIARTKDERPIATVHSFVDLEQVILQFVEETAD